jgi:hypothetical protein
MPIFALYSIILAKAAAYLIVLSSNFYDFTILSQNYIIYFNQIFTQILRLLCSQSELYFNN